LVVGAFPVAVEAVDYSITADGFLYTVENGAATIHGYNNSCTSLFEIVIPEGVESIGNSTFFGCEGLKEVHIPKSVTSIGVSAFNKSGLSTVYYGGTEEDWSKITIGGSNYEFDSAEFIYADPSEEILGYIDGDGAVNGKDANIIKQYQAMI